VSDFVVTAVPPFASNAWTITPLVGVVSDRFTIRCSKKGLISQRIRSVGLVPFATFQLHS
jgi:hypothetical protein